MQSPCVKCDKKHQNKEDYQYETCSTSCTELKLFQKAVARAQTFGPAANGQCLVCRDQSGTDYCDRCRKNAALPPVKIQSMSKGRAKKIKPSVLKAIEAGRFCECGKPIVSVGMCPGCRRRHLRHHPEEKTQHFAIRKRTYRVGTSGKTQPKCEYCGKTIERLEAGGLLARQAAGQRYAHRQCAIDSGRVIFIDGVQITHINERRAA